VDSVLRNYFLGKGFAKTETDVFEIRREFGLGFSAQEGSGRECVLGFLEWKKCLKTAKMKKQQKIV
jgi:hypothetical protein